MRDYALYMRKKLLRNRGKGMEGARRSEIKCKTVSKFELVGQTEKRNLRGCHNECNFSKRIDV